ncbi:hypothetical protein [Rhodobacter capsulatus]|jgi:NAD(P)-dependent dehydrogenase (short-subunit alcohol dehydrogenase family)|uniref:Uncharacterized protein n=1 Tax=Rhodobacter capsulatus (strain ATCC BAA-309 / NBRC 16581 / SB1003) TaxID=272942 RepID=D5AQ66_RHOCB|nr:hypothetical protein [Rhodobacter capsulatus]ADE84653.1 conserved hypothetical protein [Rhodobacter capsulatus SB 1003]ETD02615.1 hypothetical protein U714_05630 [Rhodobacter capsulatus DE442]ETD78712.1 hypothetical protein U717_05635 [Rhodobacter capsulatus R121]ETE54678.1 hypothetical protein U715_05625 [Rhodobacter capsulatus Y262]MDS0926400.1 hypothetical protein [Rhodobacter capsulatus]
MSLRPATPVLAAFGLAFALAGAEAAHAVLTAPREAARLQAAAHLVRDLGLSDLALFTEARYTRHPSLADLATAFQDNPLSFDHFPSGSLIAPPTHFGPTALAFSAGDLR